MGRKRTGPITAIRVARVKLKMTQVDTAAKAGLTYRHYQRIEYWEVIPNAIIALRIAKTLDTTVEDLWGDLLFV